MASFNYLLSSDMQSMEHVFSDASASLNTNVVRKERDNDIDVYDISMINEEEDLAIQKGIDSLKIFHDSHDYVSDHFFGLEEEEDENLCHYYESSQSDIFNQRPLPFVVGSEELHKSGVEE